MALTDLKARNAKIEPGKKYRKLFDGGGLYLFITPDGGRYWRLKFYLGEKERTLALGVYPTVGLKQARKLRDDARKKIAAGIDPGAERRAEKEAKPASAGSSFEAVAREWHGKQEAAWSAGHAKTVIQRLENDVFGWIGSRPVREITAPELLTVLRRIEERGAVEVAHRVSGICSLIFRYAVATGRAERDPVPDLRGALAPSRGGHFAALTKPSDVGALMKAIVGYEGTFIVRCALRMSAYCWSRPGEIRKAEWSEIDLDRAEWRIPARRMKMRKEHIVPLAPQVVALLRELQPMTSQWGQWVFPGGRQRSRPMSENAICAALRVMGYPGEQMSAHGFKATASTLLNEAGWPFDWIERQLAHSPRDKVRAAYNRASYLPERREMMRRWADYLDSFAMCSLDFATGSPKKDAPRKARDNLKVVSKTRPVSTPLDGATSLS